MNNQSFTATSGYRQKITLLTEVACICLLLASVIYGLRFFQQPTYTTPEDKTDQTLWTDGSAENSGTADENGIIRFPTKDFINENGNHYIIDSVTSGDITYDGDRFSASENSGTVVIRPGENGNTGTVVIRPGENGNAGTVVIRPNEPTVTTEVVILPNSFGGNMLGNVSLMLVPFLACAVLLLYALKFHGTNKENRVLTLIFGLMLLGNLVELVNHLFVIHYTRTSELILYFMPTILKIALFALLMVLTRKERWHPQLILLASGSAILFFLIQWFPLLTGPIYAHVLLRAISDILYAVGLISFYVALVICAYWRAREKVSVNENQPE